MTVVRSYSDKMQGLAAEAAGGIEHGQNVFRSASSDFLSSLAGIVLSGSKYDDPGEYIYHKLLTVSLFLKSYTSVIETLEDFRVDLNLDEFQGDV